jgi:hypothetical protein
MKKSILNKIFWFDGFFKQINSIKKKSQAHKNSSFFSNCILCTFENRKNLGKSRFKEFLSLRF